MKLLETFIQELIALIFSDCEAMLCPSDDTAVVPVNDGYQIQESVLHRIVGDVDGQRLVWTRYIGIPKQI